MRRLACGGHANKKNNGKRGVAVCCALAYTLPDTLPAAATPDILPDILHDTLRWFTLRWFGFRLPPPPPLRLPLPLPLRFALYCAGLGFVFVCAFFCRAFCFGGEVGIEQADK